MRTNSSPRGPGTVNGNELTGGYARPRIERPSSGVASGTRRTCGRGSKAGQATSLSLTNVALSAIATLSVLSRTSARGTSRMKHSG